MVKKIRCHRCLTPIEGEPDRTIGPINLCEICSMSFDLWFMKGGRENVPDTPGLFYDWAIKKYPPNMPPEGDFVMDMKVDKDFPNANDFDTLYEYLIHRGACDEAIEAFVGVWEQFEYEVRCGVVC